MKLHRKESGCEGREINATILQVSAYLASIKDRPVPGASAEVTIKSLLNLCCRAALAFAVSNGKGSVAGDHHARGAEAAL